MELSMKIARQTLVITLLLSLACATSWAVDRSPSPEGAEAYFISPMNGARVERRFTVKFGLRGMGVAPAGVDVPNTGHHHLLIDADPMSDLGQPLPANAQVRHFGKGQTEAEIELEPGTYTLQLVLGNHLHIPHEPPVVSGTIRVTVE
jgi:hypothetical protein